MFLKKWKLGRMMLQIEVVQHAGEMLYVPGLWWHAVLNLDNAVIITEDFCSANNFLLCWNRAVSVTEDAGKMHRRESQPELAYPWQKKLKVYCAKAAIFV